MLQRFLKCCQSGEISPNLVTLLHRHSFEKSKSEVESEAAGSNSQIHRRHFFFLWSGDHKKSHSFAVGGSEEGH